VEESTPAVEEAVALFRAGDLDGAEAAARSLIEDDPEAIRPRWLLASIHESRGEWGPALQELREITSLHPDYLDAGNRMGEILIRNGRRNDAAVCFSACLDADPDYVPALVNLGAMAIEEGRNEDALSWLDRAVDAVPDHANARLQRARALLALEREEEAREEVRAALGCPDLRPDQREAAEKFLAE
jgi:tetratricopeptide (TPR) repeat protein